MANSKSDTAEKIGAKVWAIICAEQGWNDSSKVIHLEGFLHKMGLFSKFSDYIIEVAKEENSFE